MSYKSMEFASDLLSVLRFCSGGDFAKAQDQFKSTGDKVLNQLIYKTMLYVAIKHFKEQSFAERTFVPQFLARTPFDAYLTKDALPEIPEKVRHNARLLDVMKIAMPLLSQDAWSWVKTHPLATIGMTACVYYYPTTTCTAAGFYILSRVLD
jgi:hypothetical protein